MQCTIVLYLNVSVHEENFRSWQCMKFLMGSSLGTSHLARVGGTFFWTGEGEWPHVFQGGQKDTVILLIEDILFPLRSSTAVDLSSSIRITEMSFSLPSKHVADLLRKHVLWLLGFNRSYFRVVGGSRSWGLSVVEKGALNIVDLFMPSLGSRRNIYWEYRS